MTYVYGAMDYVGLYWAFEGHLDLFETFKVLPYALEYLFHGLGLLDLIKALITLIIT